MDSTETSLHETSSPDSATKAHSDQMVKAFHCTYGLPAIVTYRFDNDFKAADYRFNVTSIAIPASGKKAVALRTSNFEVKLNFRQTFDIHKGLLRNPLKATLWKTWQGFGLRLSGLSYRSRTGSKEKIGRLNERVLHKDPPNLRELEFEMVGKELRARIRAQKAQQSRG